MAKEPNVKLTKFELEVMEALWGLGSGSVREVQERLPAAKRPAYTTVQTIVYRLEEKGAVRRVKKVGNAHVFEPAVTRRAAVRRLLDDLLELFGGSPRALVAQLVETGRLSLEDVREVEGTLARLAGEEVSDASEASTAKASETSTAEASAASRTAARRERRRR
jgi:BlaI family transcriptional regulator, penicillinase repressor